MSLEDKILNAYFLSVNFRTSGFNAIDIAGLKDSSLFFSTLYMMIGGGHGSTAGGIKITTVAILVVAVVYLLRGDEKEPSIFEVVSAFATVGLSTGNGDILSFSAHFDNFGKSVIITLMLAGRLGIFAFGVFLIGNTKQRQFSYPKGKVFL